MKRIFVLYTDQVSRQNLRLVFTYLKECYTILQFKRAGMKYEPKVRVSVDKFGFPKIIPHNIRDLLISNRNLFVSVSTLLGVHRVIP
jgi:hypothetical protein